MTKSDWGRYAWLRDYWWAVYPVMAVMFMFFSFKVIGNVGQSWTEAAGRQRELEEGRKKAEVSRRKLATLEGMDEEEMRQGLVKLVMAVPASKQLFAAVSELKSAATGAGIRLEKYSAKVGEIREASESAVVSTGSKDLELAVSLTVFDLSQLRGFLAALERQLPIMRVIEVRYTLGGVQMTVRQPVDLWVKQNPSVDTPLPDYQVKYAEVSGKLQLYESLLESLDEQLGGDGDVATESGRRGLF